MRALAAEFLEAGHSVVLDSPCGWPSIEEAGRALAAHYGTVWALIETNCPTDVLETRLATRAALESQPQQREDWYGRPGMRRPACPMRVLDSTRSIGELSTEAMAYLTKLTQPGSGVAVPHRTQELVR
jgi:hypothetical protein